MKSRNRAINGFDLRKFKIFWHQSKFDVMKKQPGFYDRQEHRPAIFSPDFMRRRDGLLHQEMDDDRIVSPGLLHGFREHPRLRNELPDREKYNRFPGISPASPMHANQRILQHQMQRPSYHQKRVDEEKERRRVPVSPQNRKILDFPTFVERIRHPDLKLSDSNPTELSRADVRMFRDREQKYKFSKYSDRCSVQQVGQRWIREFDLIAGFENYCLKNHGSIFGPLSLIHRKALRDREPNLLFPGVILILPHEHKHLGPAYHLRGYDFCNPNHLIASEETEKLVPIRIEIGENVRYRDYFLININDRCFSPELIAEITLNDVNLFDVDLKSSMAQCIKDHLEDFSQIKQVESAHQDLRIIIYINITVNTTVLIDHFEWDIMCKENNPELFAEVLCSELNLPMEFKTAISHSIREQSLSHLKALLDIGYQFDGSPIADLDDTLASLFQRPVVEMRSLEDYDFFSPKINEITQEEMEREERDMDREARRRRRGVRKQRFIFGKPGESQRLKIQCSKLKLAQKKIQNRNPEFDILIPFIPKKNVSNWRCGNCNCSLSSTPVLRHGPLGENSLCNACGLYFTETGQNRKLKFCQVRPCYPFKITHFEDTFAHVLLNKKQKYLCFKCGPLNLLNEPHKHF